MRIVITCEDCDHRNRLERSEFTPGPINIICHGCELPLQATFEASTTALPADHPELHVVAPVQHPPSGFSFLTEPPSSTTTEIRSERSHA